MTTKKVNGKAKGKTFEREVANFLTETYGQKFIRTPNSGAFVGGGNAYRKQLMDEKQVKIFKGDLIPPDDWVYLNTEAKNYKDFLFHMLFTEESKVLDTWIDQMKHVAEPNDCNIIFMKFNRKGRWVCYEDNNPFKVSVSIPYKGWVFCAWENFWTTENTELFKTRCQDLGNH